MKELISSRMMLRDDEYDVEGYVEYHEEKHWGADADGNRGTCKTIVDDVIDIVAYQDGEDIELTKDEKQLIADRLTRKFLEN